MSDRGGQRIDVPSLFDDPEQMHEMLINMIIMMQAHDGIEVTREQAEAVHERIWQELRRTGQVSNPGNPGLDAAKRTFKRFHSKPAEQAVYPFNQNQGSIIELDRIDWPDEIYLLGEAMRTLYESDKWHRTGQTTQYYHDHDARGVRFLVPKKESRKHGGLQPADMPCDWPSEVTLIGECIGFVVRPEPTGKITEGVMKGKNILVCSPDGWLDPMRPERVFLAIINLSGEGCVEAIIEGGNLRITAHGIEG